MYKGKGKQKVTTLWGQRTSNNYSSQSMAFFDPMHKQSKFTLKNVFLN